MILDPERHIEVGRQHAERSVDQPFIRGAGCPHRPRQERQPRLLTRTSMLLFSAGGST
jgi:hypothetical protein